MAQRHQRRAGLLRHRAHLGVAPRPDGYRSSTTPTCSSAGPSGPGSSATTPPTWCATATAGWSRPAPGATSTAAATTRASRSPSRAPTPTCCAGATCSTPSRWRCPSTASLGRRVGPAPGAHRPREGPAGWSATSARRSSSTSTRCSPSGPDARPRCRCGPPLTSRRATEGTTLVRWDERWRVLASDGRDNPRRHRAAVPRARPRPAPDGAPLDAPYPTNIPWPTLAPLPDGDWLLVDLQRHAASAAGSWATAPTATWLCCGPRTAAVAEDTEPAPRRRLGVTPAPPLRVSAHHRHTTPVARAESGPSCP